MIAVAAFLFLVSGLLAPALADDIDIRFAPDANTFPAFLTAHVEAQPLPVSEQSRCASIVRLEARKYPPELLQRLIKHVYLLRSISADGTEVGGLNYLSVGSICLRTSGCTDSYIARLLHHEMTHLITSDRFHRFPYRALIRLNPPDFQYGRGGLESIRAGVTMSDGDDSIRASGFARPYGKSDLQEDIACIGEMMFSGDDDWWRSVDKHAVLRSKVELLTSYLSEISPDFNLNFFRLLPQSPFSMRPPKYREGDLVVFPDGGTIVTPADPRRIIEVPAGCYALFPERSSVRFSTRSTLSLDQGATENGRLVDPVIPAGQLLFHGTNGCWLLVSSIDPHHPSCKPDSTIYFQFGGSIYTETKREPTPVQAGRYLRYPPGSVVLFSPRLHPA